VNDAGAPRTRSLPQYEGRERRDNSDYVRQDARSLKPSSGRVGRIIGTPSANCGQSDDVHAGGAQLANALCRRRGGGEPGARDTCG